MRIFKSMDRLPQLIKYYRKCQLDALLKKWHFQLEQDESVIQCVHNFYNDLLSNWHVQYRWFGQVFMLNDTNAINDVLVDIYVNTLTSLEPSINDCVDATLKQVSDKMGLLIELKQTIKQFAESLTSIIETAYGKCDFK